MPVTTRPRRTRAQTARMTDMDMDSDGDVEMQPEPRREDQRRGRESESKEVDDEGEEELEEGSNVDVEAVAEGDEDENEEEVVDEDDEDEDDVRDEDEEDDDQEDEIQSDADAGLTSQPPPTPSSRLKIRLKIPRPQRSQSPIIESEDSLSSDGESQPSTSRPMTTRQAVLASVLDSTHVSLTGSRQKKAPLNETELALRREETARKRKNMTEKKLEDEKAETINRLLKKQSKPRNKRTTAQRNDRDMDDVLPGGSLSVTRSNSVSAPASRKKKTGDEQDEAGDEDEDEEVGEVDHRDVHVPTMYRWVSTSRVPTVDGDGDMVVDAPPTMRISFSVPLSVLPAPSSPAEADVQAQPLQPRDNEEEEKRRSARPKACAAPGCGKPVRYRLVRDWTQGACGMPCLKTLEASL